MRSILVATALCLAAAGCGSSGTKAAPTTSSPGNATTTTTTTSAPAGTTPSPLQGEAASAAAGDIPDNQVFLTFRNGAAGYSMKYPEGWAQRGSGTSVTFRDKNNIARVVVLRGAVPAPGALERELRGLPGVNAVERPSRVHLAGAPAWKVSYRTVSAPNPVTGKRVTLMVDRYYLARGGKEAIVDLGTPVGVDNVDAYRLMAESFRWR